MVKIPLTGLAEAAEESGLYPKRVWLAFVWCVPALAGFVFLLFSDPLSHRILFWPYLKRAQLFQLWFLFITPLTTTLAIAALIQGSRPRHTNALVRILAWTVIAISVLMNALVLIATWESD